VKVIKGRMQMSIRFEWNEILSVENEELDRQHKEMFDLANSFEDGLDEQRIKEIIKTLYKYTSDHFMVEEQMMYENNYPKLKKHQQLHKDLIAKLDDFSTQPFKDDKSIFIFVTFVYDWLSHHIIEEDKDYMRFKQDRRKILDSVSAT
jgi:hemerythrin